MRQRSPRINDRSSLGRSEFVGEFDVSRLESS
jgi:hypothetical protein